MMIGRRTFIRDTLLVASAPALASVTSMAPWVPALASPEPPVRQPIASGARTDCVIFKIDGWDRRDGMAIDTAMTLPAVPPDNSSPDHHVWIAVNRSWRAAWR